MCLAVPGRVAVWLNRDPLLARALVEFDGVRREVSMACVPEACEGDFVLVHAGLALSTLQPEEAERTLALWEEVAADEVRR